MLKKEFETVCMQYRGSAFARFAKLLNDKKYGKKETSCDTNNKTFLQIELLEKVELANLDRPVNDRVVLPPFITLDQLTTITSVMKNDILQCN